MMRKPGVDLGPNLILALGMILATLIAVLAAESRWLVLAGPLVQALSVGGADTLRSRLEGGAFGPSRTASVLAGAFLLAGVIVALRDPNLVKTLIPTQGAVAWVTLLLRPAGERRPCSHDSWV